jgi:hypothetical protein
MAIRPWKLFDRDGLLKDGSGRWGEEHLHLAINTAKGIGAKSILGQAYLELGKLHKAKGKVEKARECISNAIEAFEKCEADVFLKQAKEAMETLI